jgi:hypothetical protein
MAIQTRLKIFGIPVPDIFLKPTNTCDGPKGEPNLPLIVGAAVVAVVSGLAAVIFKRK